MQYQDPMQPQDQTQYQNPVQPPIRRSKYPFVPSPIFIRPRKAEVIFALIYLFLHFFVMGVIIAVLGEVFGLSLSPAELNLLYMGVGAIVLCVVLHRYLWVSFRQFVRHGFVANLREVGIGYGMNFFLIIPISLLIVLLIPEVQNPNQEMIEEMIDTEFWQTFVLAVILAPIVEEILFRGGIFAPLFRRNRILAYAISSLLFAFVHILGALFLVPSVGLILIMFLYVPAGIACAWVYERSGSIWTAIVLHMVMNLIAVLIASA